MQVAERELQLLDVPKPRVLARGGDSGVEVRLNHSEPVGLRWVDLQEAATHASVFVGAARTVRAYAVTEFDFPPAEVLTEFLEFFGRGLAVLLDRPFCAAPGNKLLVMFDDLGGVSGGVPAGGVEVIVTGELGSDVYRQSVADRVCQKDASEVMRTER